MRDWLMVRVREPPWYLAVGMEKYIRNILFFFFLLLLSPLSRTLGTRVTIGKRSEDDRNRMDTFRSARRIFWWRAFKPRVARSTRLFVGEHKNRPHSALTSSPRREAARYLSPPRSDNEKTSGRWLKTRLRCVPSPLYRRIEHFQNSDSPELAYIETTNVCKVGKSSDLITLIRTDG